jgi:hypothetical protein
MKGFEIENEITGFDFIVCFRSDIGGGTIKNQYARLLQKNLKFHMLMKPKAFMPFNR